MSTHPTSGGHRWRPMVVRGRHDGRPPLDVRVRTMLERRDRTRLADGLELMVLHAQRPEGVLGPRVPVVPAQVLDAREALEEIERLLRSDVQLDPRGTALVRALLVDGCGPAYAGGRRGALLEAALHARNALVPYRWAG
ncbi:hypothetical protein [Patulibacter defluvii]|uniref:hypothetical protein n=1 Tax=Patulibacter defluvii TaxID=3095358 RepID=UPI002A757F6A|nr:hypothetical protein [Patulibacter sp. DM4]